DASPDTSDDASGADDSGGGGTTEDADDGPEPDPPRQKETVFNVPGADGTADEAIEDEIIQLLEATPNGASVRAAYYLFSRTRIADAFVDAYDRGVDVEIVLGNTNVRDNCEDWNAVTRLKDGLGANRVTVCRECEDGGACIGSRIQHNKFITFSELDDGSSDVVAQSSANLTNPQRKKYNDLVVIRDDSGLYDGYVDYWNDLKAQQRDDAYYHRVNGDTNTRAYFYPRESGDTILSVLDNVECHSNARIRLAMSIFTNTRVAVAEELADKQRDGCQVEVLLNESAGSDVVSELQDANATVHLHPTGGDVRIHAKYLLVEAPYYNGNFRRLVWTGSHNYSGPALRRNDETLLRIEDRDVYDEYLDNWRLIRHRIESL
ncbi:MAG: phospholipase D-like domain-containing protein, partial [Persicimonas sp.]